MSVCRSDVCLTSVAHIGPKWRTERPRRTKIGTEVAHVTRDSDTTFKVKGQGHQAAILTAVLALQAAAAVGVGTCWPWETAATLPSARPREALRTPTGRRRAGHIVAACFTAQRLCVCAVLAVERCLAVTRERVSCFMLHPCTQSHVGWSQSTPLYF